MHTHAFALPRPGRVGPGVLGVAKLEEGTQSLKDSQLNPDGVGQVLLPPTCLA